MKILKILVLLVLCSSCGVWIGEGTEGSGKVTKQVHILKSFNAIHLGVVYEVIIIPSDSEKVIVETDDNLQPFIIVENNENLLTINMKPNTNISRKTIGKIYIYARELNEITNNSVGKLDNEGVLKSKNLVLNNSAVGSTELKIEAYDVTLNNSAVGKTELFGSCNNLKIHNSAVGSLNTQEFKCNFLDLDNHGVGKTAVFANKEFIINNSAVGSLDIYGEGEIKKINSSSIGSFKKH